MVQFYRLITCLLILHPSFQVFADATDSSSSLPLDALINLPIQEEGKSEWLEFSTRDMDPESLDNSLVPFLKSYKEFTKLLESIEDKTKADELIKMTTFGGLKQFLDETDSLSKAHKLDSLTWELNSIFDTSAKPDINAAYKPVMRRSFANLNDKLTKKFNYARKIAPSVVLARNLMMPLLWESINLKTLSVLKNHIEEEIRPSIWHQLQDSIEEQVRYQIRLQKRTSILNPNLFRANILIGNYKRIHIKQPLDSLNLTLKNFAEDESIDYALKKLLHSVYYQGCEPQRKEIED